MAQDISFDIVARDKASRTFDKISNSSNKTHAVLGKFAKGAALGGAAIASLGVAATAFTVKAGAGYVASLNKIQALGDLTDTQLTKVAKTLEGQSGAFAKMGQTTGDAASGMVELVKAGLSVDNALKSVTATMTLAKAGELSVADASSLVANTLNTFHLKAQRAGDIANYLANAANISSADVADLAESMKYVGPVAASTGVSLKQTSAILAELSNSGIDASNAGTGFRKFLLSLQAPAGKAKKDLHGLGVEIFDSSGKMKPLGTVIDSLGSKLNKLTDKKRQQILKDVFGLQGISSAQVILSNGASGLAEYTKGVEKAGAAQKLANANSKGLMGTLLTLKAEVTSLAQSLYREFSPAVNDVLVPFVAKFGELSTTAIPAIREFAANISAFFHGSSEGANQARSSMGQLGTTLKEFLANAKSTFSSIASIAHSFWAEYGDLITKYGINTLKNLLTSLRGAMNIIAGLFKVVAAVMKGDWSGAWKGIKQIALGAMQLIRGSVGQFLNQLKALFAAGARTLGVLMRAAWDGVVNAVRSGISHAVALIKSLPGKMLKAVGNLDKLLYNAGKAVISGLIQGIGDKVGDLVGKLKSVTNLIPKHKGPIDKDRALLRPAGVAIMDGLIAGIEGQKMKLATALEKITNLIAKARDRIASLKQTKADFKSTFSADSIFGADLETSGNSLAGLLDFQKQQAAKARQLAADVARVTKLGLSGSLIKQLQAAGSSGEDQLHLLAGASAAQIRQFNALNAQTQSSLGAAGLQAGNYARGGNIDADIKRAQRQERVLEAILKYLARQHGEDVVVKIGPDAIIRIIRKHAKDRGVSVASLLGI